MKTISHNSGLVGDSLCALPAIWEKAHTEGQVALWMDNQAVQHLLPASDAIVHLSEKPDTADYQMDVGPVFSKYVSTAHMSQGYYDQLGLPVPQSVPESPVRLRKLNQIREAKDSMVAVLAAPWVDVLISPFSRSDHNHNKKWFDDRWVIVVRHLIQLGHKVCVLGSAEDRLSRTAKAIHHAGSVKPAAFVEVYGEELSHVLDLIRQAKMCLTIDNGISHCVAALQVPHLLLYPKCLPFPWVRNPNGNAHHIHDEPVNIKSSQVCVQMTLLLDIYSRGEQTV